MHKMELSTAVFEIIMETSQLNYQVIQFVLHTEMLYTGDFECNIAANNYLLCKDKGWI